MQQMYSPGANADAVAQRKEFEANWPAALAKYFTIDPTIAAAINGYSKAADITAIRDKVLVQAATNQVPS
jgi:hypothetical protein